MNSGAAHTVCIEGAEGWHRVKAGRGLCPQHEHIFSGDRKNGLDNVMAGKCLYYQVSPGPRDQTARLATLSVPPVLGESKHLAKSVVNVST